MKKYQQIIPLKRDDTVYVKAYATLDIEGWEKEDISIETDLNVQRIRREGHSLYFLFMDDVTLRVPVKTLVVVEKAALNARLRRMTGKLKISNVGGNLAVQQAGDVIIERVSGSCLVQDIEGKLLINGISGNLKGTEIHGSVFADHLSAAVELLSLYAGAEIRTSGDIKLSFSQDSTDPVRLRSSSDISLNLPFELDAEFKIKSNAHLTELQIGERFEQIQYRKHTLLVGDGKRKFDLDAEGKVRIVAERIEDSQIIQLFKELEMLWDELKQENSKRRLEKEKELPGTSVDDGVELSMDEMKQAEERVQQALAQVENRLRHLGYDVPAPESEKKQQTPPEVRDLTGERLIIMRLLGENKITIDEADKLLEALEGAWTAQGIISEV